MILKIQIFNIVKIIILILLCTGFVTSASAASKEEIDIKVGAAIEKFKSDVTGGEQFLSKAKGILIFPEVVKAGFGIGGEYGEGALLINNNTIDYYNTAAASFGFQLGAQLKTIILVFLKEKALDKFRNSSGWEAGVDGSVALIELGAGKDINTINIKDPIVGFVFSNKGLMYNLTLEGSKITRLDK